MSTATSSSPGVHYSAVERKIPAWLKESTPAERARLRDWQQAPAWLATAVTQQPDIAKAWQEEHARHRQHQARVQTLFDQLPDLQSFARKVLADGIKDRFGLDLDVDRTYLIDARLINADSAVDGRQAVDRATRSLLHCALHNFDAKAAGKNGMDAPAALLKKSVMLDHRRYLGSVPIINAIDITAEAFADLCRTLNIGARYHDLVHAIYYPTATAERSADEVALDVYQTLGSAEVSAFRQSLHFARLKGDIDQGFHDAALAAPLDKPPTANASITFSTLTLWEAELTGILAVTWQTDGQQCLALYTPQDDDTPLKAFNSMDALTSELSDRLRANIGYLDKHIADRDKALVQKRLADRLTPFGWSIRGLHERVPDADAVLYPTHRPFKHAFQGMMAFQKAERHEMDVLYHAIPTEIVDRRTAQAHRELIFGRVLTGLNIAGFFVPGLGEAMLALCVTQLAFEVYDGIEAWENDERDTAYTYMVDVIENVAVMAALAAAAKAVRAKNTDQGAMTEGAEPVEPEVEEPEIERIPVETPSFIEELEDVEMPDGQVSLWKPDLATYRRNEVLPDHLQPDALGLRQHQGRLWLETQGERYVVEQASATAEYRVKHPQGPHRYGPPVRHNGAGAWLHVTDQPATWSGTALLRRIGHLSGRFDESTLHTILAITDTDEGVLRRALVENRRLPALLEDTMQRFELDNSIRQLPGSSARVAEFDRAYHAIAVAQLPGTEAILRVYPQLPPSIVDEVVRSASADERRMLDTGKVPLRLAQEIRVFQQQVRLTRAYEGLYLDAVRSWDADRLILHTLARLPQWPSSLVIELEQHGYLPAESMRIGNASAEPDVSILSTKAGYLVLDDTTANAPGQVHGSLYSALAVVLPAPIRQALVDTGVPSPLALKRLLQTPPLLARSKLREVLRMQPVRPGYRSPMRLADGRLGYPMGGASGAGQLIRRPTVLRIITQLGLPRHSSHSAGEILGILETRGLDAQQINECLQSLGRERNELTRYLDEWRDAALAGTGNAQEVDLLHDQLMQCWYDHAWRSENSEAPGLRLEHVSVDIFPTDLPSFLGERVTCLELIAPSCRRALSTQQRLRRLTRLLLQFPNLRSLEISTPAEGAADFRAPIGTLRSISDNVPKLEVLKLTNQHLMLTTADFDSLQAMQQLRQLTLDDNAISPFCTEEFGTLRLDYLSLEGMSLRHFPASLSSRRLNRIGEVSLRRNRIRSLPDFLIGNEQYTLPHTIIHLEGNEIFESQLLRILISHEGIPERIHFDRSSSLDAQMRRFSIPREQLHEATYGWVNAASSTAPPSPPVMAMRNRISSTLNTYWRDVELGSHSPLRLDNIALEHFPPRLPSFFNEHVRALSITRISSTVEQLEAFFQPFSSLQVLTCSYHAQPTQAIASTLLNLPQLRDLFLPEMGLVIDNEMLAIFGQLTTLRTLDLTRNRLGEITHVPAALSNLRRLDLSDMQISQWPGWVEHVLPLDLLDLSGNELTDLPDHVLNNPDTEAQVTSVRLVDNPLSPETLDRARRSSATQRRFTFAFSPPADAPPGGHLHLPRAIDAEDRPDLRRWLSGTQEQNEALRDAWQELKRVGDASHLQALVGRLQQAAPFRNGRTRAAFAERVRMVLIRAVVNEQDRALFDQAAQDALVQPDTGDQTCHDGVMRVFYDIESFIANQRLLADHADTESGLYQALKRLYRLERLGEIARDKAGARDQAEVYLAYRRGANEPLQLGVPRDDMLFEAVADVYHDELTRAIEQVLRDERGDGFLNYAMENQQWGRYLRSAHPDEFNAIEQAYQANVLDLPNHYPEETSIDDLASEYAALLHRMTEQERQLIRDLTLQASPDRS